MHSEIRVIPSRSPLSSPSGKLGYLAPAAEGGATGTRSSNKNRILIVEDDVLVASEIETALSDAGFEVVGVVASGNEALQVAALHSPTLIVMDVRLSGDRDGIDTALEIYRSHGIRCIFASAYSDRDSRLRAEPATPLGWLQKPYTMTSLTAMVRAALAELRRPD